MGHNQPNSLDKHLWIMLACCIIPLALIVAIGMFGFGLGGLTSLLPFLLAGLCPLMMFSMMRGMQRLTHPEHAAGQASAPRALPIGHETGPGSAAARTAAPEQEQCH